MIKRIFLAFICVALIIGAFSVAAFAAPEDVDIKVGDVKLYTDKTELEKGDFFTVEIYIENITAKNGILGVDLPLTYDKSKLAYIKMECVYPSSWGPYGEFLGHDTPDEDPWYLRSVSSASDYVTNPAYRIKADKEIGYKLTFRTIAEGEAFVAVENAGNHNIMLPSLEDRVMNYGANGMTLKLTIGGEDVSSADPDNSSVEPSEDPSEDKGESSDVSSEDVTEDVTKEESSTADSSVPETSIEESGAVSEESEEASVSGDANTSDDTVDSSDADDGIEAKSGGINIAGIFLAIAGVFVAIALAGLGIFFAIRSRKNNN